MSQNNNTMSTTIAGAGEAASGGELDRFMMDKQRWVVAGEFVCVRASVKKADILLHHILYHALLVAVERSAQWGWRP